MALTIGDLGKATNTKVETIRYYERIGLLAKPDRTGGNYRAYGQDALARLSFIRRARDLGFSLDQVRELLTLASQDQRDCGSVDAIANSHLAEIDRKLADLASLRDMLSHLIDHCNGDERPDCPIIDGLAGSATVQ